MTVDGGILITGARLIDGTRNPWFFGDVVLRGDTIAEVTLAGRASVRSTETVDATGFVVCPGFIDFPSHSIVGCFGEGSSNSSYT